MANYDKIKQCRMMCGVFGNILSIISAISTEVCNLYSQFSCSFHIFPKTKAKIKITQISKSCINTNTEALVEFHTRKNTNMSCNPLPPLQRRDTLPWIARQALILSISGNAFKTTPVCSVSHWRHSLLNSLLSTLIFFLALPTRCQHKDPLPPSPLCAASVHLPLLALRPFSSCHPELNYSIDKRTSAGMCCIARR